MKLSIVFLLIAAFLALEITSSRAISAAPSPKPRQMEKLGRGVVAVQFEAGKVFVGWRVLGTDPSNIAFNLYRSANSQKPVRVNQQPLVLASSIVDEQADIKVSNSYFVRPVINGREQSASASFTLAANAPVRQYLSIPLKITVGYGPNDASVGDLNGDGEYEIVVHQVGRGRDNSQAGTTTEPILEAYKLDGTMLWQINLGKNIREGAHYTQFMVYDLDGDGIAEVACKTADGTIDGVGKVIGDPKADYREPEGAVVTYKNARTGNEEKHNVTGYVLSGPEYLTIFDGRTGAALATTNYVPPRHPSSMKPSGDELAALWADGWGNRVDRFLACIAYLDGVRPSLVMARGYYTRTVLSAWDWRNGKLTQRWTFDSDSSPDNRKFRGQGNHNLTVADVDMDGRDEIVYGAAVIDDNGSGLYSTGLGHGDALHVSDLDPDRPGLEVFDIQERFDDAGASFRDARTGEIIWKKPSVQAGGDGEGPGRGLALDIDPAHRGYESWVRGAGVVGLWNAKGEKLSDKTPLSCNFGVWWDGDLLGELLDRNTISKWNPSDQTETVLLRDAACSSNNGTKATPTLSADILGDWREEVIWRTTDNKELRIYTTVIPTKYRFYTLMHDPQYRLSIAWQNVAYNQPPHTGFYLGEGMAQPPKPNIVVIEPKRR